MTKPLTILVVCPWYPAGPMRYISEAFERMGLNVFRVGATYNDHAGVDWKNDIVHPDLELQREFPRWDLNEFVDIATRAGHTPDILLLSEENYRTIINPTTKVPTGFWSMDGWPQNFLRGDALSPTVKYTNHARGIRAHPLKETPPGWIFMPGATAPWVHRDLAIGRNLDFCLLAAMYGYRAELSQHLADIGYAVKYGYETTSEFVKTYNRSKFTYCNVNGNGGEAKWRFWEAASCGCVNIVDEGDILLNQLGYMPNVHYVPVKIAERENGEPWPTNEMLEEALNGAINDPDCFIEMSIVAKEKSLQQDTYYHRATQILGDLGFDISSISLESRIRHDRLS